MFKVNQNVYVITPKEQSKKHSSEMGRIVSLYKQSGQHFAEVSIVNGTTDHRIFIGVEKLIVIGDY